MPSRVTGCFVDLYWLPVGAGTSRAQQASLRCWEAVSAALSRRPRAALYHPALKVGREDSTAFTLELTPMFVGGPAPPAMTGPVGFRGADRFRLFRYQLRRLQADSLPDEEWAVASPIRLSGDCLAARTVLSLATAVPPYTWGRRAKGTGEMWTSASVIAWILLHAGIDATRIQLPPGGRAPGWQAGIDIGLRDLEQSTMRTHT